MTFRATWILLFVVLILAGGIWWFELRDPGTPSGREAALLPFTADSLESVEVQHSGRHFLLSQRNDRWVLLSPVEAPCDPEVMERLLTVLDEARVEQNLGSGEDERYGLDLPTSRMTLRGPGGASVQLQFGNINPLQTLVYCKRDASQDVLLTTSELLTLSLNTAFGWRDKRVVDVPPESVHRIRLSTISQGSLVVQRGDDDLWRVQGDIAWRVDPVRMQNLLLALSQMRAVAVTAEGKVNPEKYGLGNRQLSALLEDADGNVLADIVLGFATSDESNHVIVPDKPEIFRAGGALSEVLSLFVADCRDRKVFPPFDARQVTRVEVNGPSDAFAIERKSVTRWGVVHSSHHDSTFVLDPEAIQETLETLLALQLDEFPEPQPASRHYDPAEMTVRLSGASGPLSGIQVGRKDPGGFLTLVRGIDEPAVFLVAPGKLIELPFDLKRLGVERSEMPQEDL